MDISSTSGSSGLISGLSSTMTQIASGKQINTSADSPSSIQILEQFNSQVIGNQQAHRNIIDSVSSLQVAQGGLSQITDSLHQLRELGIQAGNGTLNADNRQAIQKQGDELVASIKDALSQSQFNNQSLLGPNSNNQASNNTIQTGAAETDQLPLPSFDLFTEFENSGLFDLDFSAPGVNNALNSIDLALNVSEGVNSELGSIQNRLEFSASNLSTSIVNQSSARSEIQDTDYAKAVTELTKQQLAEDIKITLLSQANAKRGDVLNLLK